MFIYQSTVIYSTLFGLHLDVRVLIHCSCLVACCEYDLPLFLLVYVYYSVWDFIYMITMILIYILQFSANR